MRRFLLLLDSGRNRLGIGQQEAIDERLRATKKAERKRNAGGVAPNAKRHALKLLAAIIRLKQRFSVQVAPHLDANLTNTEKISPLDRALLLFLYLWLINRLPHCHSIEDIPIFA